MKWLKVWSEVKIGKEKKIDCMDVYVQYSSNFPDKLLKT